MRRSLTIPMALLLVACGDDPVLTPTVPTNISRLGSEVGTPGWLLSEGLSVVVRDDRGEPLEGITVEWSSIEEGAWFGAATSETDGVGVATVAFAPGWRVGDQRVRATVGVAYHDVEVAVSSFDLKLVASTGNGGRPLCGLDAEGALWCWSHLAVQNRAAPPEAFPEDARPVALDAAIRYRDLIGTDNGNQPGGHCGLTMSNVVRCWEYTGDGSLTPTPPLEVDTPVPFVSLVGGYRGLCGLDQAGQAWCKGDNAYGQLGNGTLNPGAEFAPVAGTQRFRALFGGGPRYCGRDFEDLVWCWGASQNNPVVLTPTRMASDLRVERIGFTHGSACAIGLLDHQLYCWWGGRMEGLPIQGTDAVSVATGGSLIDFVGNRDLGVFLWAGGRLGFAGDMVHDMGVNRFVQRPSELPSAPGDFILPIPSGFDAIVSRGGDWWCGAHGGGATLCSYRVGALAGVPTPH